ncbi:MAG: hypothetical protein J1E38_02030 [Paramuribaculum sp.]|nr:hypothetical protein [Paramuribaculum sp.]
MKKLSFLFCALLITVITSCSGEGDIDKAFNLVQQNAPAAEVSKEIKPVLQKADLHNLPMEAKCKLFIVIGYLDFDDETFEGLTEEREDEIYTVLDELYENPQADKIFNQMTGTAKDVYVAIMLISSFNNFNEDLDYSDME